MEIFSITVPAWALVTGVILLIGVFLKLVLKILLVIIIGSVILFVLNAAGFFGWLQDMIYSAV